MSNIKGTEKQIEFANTIIDTLIGMSDEQVPENGTPAQQMAAGQRNQSREIFRQTARVIKVLVEDGAEAAQDAFESNPECNAASVQSMVDAEAVVQAGEVIEALKGAFYNLAQ